MKVLGYMGLCVCYFLFFVVVVSVVQNYTVFLVSVHLQTVQWLTNF